MLGYEITPEPGVLRYGDQPVEAVLSVICSEFGCTPAEALQQDRRLVLNILETRQAQEAVRLFNQGREGVKALSEQPHLTDLLLRMERARDVPMQTAEQVYGLMAQASDTRDAQEQSDG